MKIAIFNKYRDEIINEIEKNYHLSIRVKIYKSSDSLLKEISKFDLVITDVIDNEKNIIQEIKNSISEKIYIIFVTEHKEMMKYCFGINVLSFLSLNELDDLSHILCTLDQRIGKEIIIRNQDNVKILPLNQIMYIEYNLRDLYFYLDNGTVEKKVNVNLNSIFNDLNSHFMMINRKTIVNLLFVSKLEESYIEVGHKINLKVSVRRRKELYERLISMRGR